MIRISQFRGNLGNHLFQVASMVGLAKRYSTNLCLPNHWKFASCFLLPNTINFKNTESYITLTEPDFHYCIDFFDRLETIIKNEVATIEGYLQSYKYWIDYDNEIKAFLAFNKVIAERAVTFLKKNNIDTNQFVAISVRRGDFVTNPNHYLLPNDYYVGAFLKYFNHHKIILFSDDIGWCKENFYISNTRITYCENMNAIDQLALMSMFRNFIIANSTFSWWGAYLSKEKKKKIIRPYHHFDGYLKTISDIKDHYPTDWIAYNFENDTEDVT